MGWSRRFKLAVSFSVVLLFMPINTYANSQDTLIPMGHSIGIKMDLSGVFVTNDVMLGKDRWLKAGDLIEQVDSVPISKLENFEKSLSNLRNKNNVSLLITRNGKSFQVQTDSDATKRLIPFLKDRTEGTGTLTYVDPKKGTYGALGHQIIDSSFNSPPSFIKGAIYLSEIGQIRKSVPGQPGYKISSIIEDGTILGTIKNNSIYGIFGTWNDVYKKVLAEPLEIMQPNQVKVGEAEIYTTVQGTEVESFSIRITNIEKDQFQFILTDRKLLEKTGGILQGMSGSPVI
jgi:stage IV sporulation protein B